MTFAEIIKGQRKSRNMTQAEFAQMVGLTVRTLQEYERGNQRPRTREVYKKIADKLELDVNYLLTESDEYILKAREKGGTKAARDVEELVSELTALFAGGQLPEESMNGAMKALNEAFWEAKETNKKYTPKKYRTDEN